MNEQQVIDLINQWIVTNGNNEITANVLRPILLAMVGQPNDLIGDLSQLITTDTTTIVNAINSILTDIANIDNNSVKLFQGVDNPNTTPPTGYKVSDFYAKYDLSNNLEELYQYDGFTWKPQGSDNKIKPIYVELDSILGIGDTVATYINQQSISVSESEIPLFLVTQEVPISGGGGGSYISEKHYLLNMLGKGNYGLGGIKIQMSDLILTYNNQATADSIADLPTTQTIDLGIITGTLSDALVGLLPEFIVQEQSVGYRLIKSNIGGEDKEFLYTGVGGLNSSLIITDSEFKPFGNNDLIEELNDKTDKGGYLGTAQDLKELIDNKPTLFTTDASLYLDPTTNELRANTGLSTENFEYESGVQEFTLVDEPSFVISLMLNLVAINNPLTDYSIDGKKLTILKPIEPTDKINITYQFIITT